MRIGLPREIKNHEYRVGLTPASVRELTAQTIARVRATAEAREGFAAFLAKRKPAFEHR